MMKRIIKKGGKLFLITSLSCSLILFPMYQRGVRANWLDNWYTNVMTTSSGFNYFETQQRGYMTFGSFGLRLPTRTDYLFSIEKPYLRLGCGGIDLFMGGFSFLNPEYLVQKAQLLLQAAPFVAFDIALSTLWPTGSEIIKKVTSIIDALNQIQISECGITMPKTIKHLFEDPSGFFNLQGEKHAEIQQKKGITDLWDQFKKKMIRWTSDGTTIDKSSAYDPKAGLSPVLKAWLDTNGSLGFVEYLAQSNYVDKEVAKIFQAYVGDLRFQKSPDSSLYQIKADLGCKEAVPQNFFSGQEVEIIVKDGTTCTKVQSQKILNDVQKILSDAYIKIINRQSPDNRFITLVRNSPAPLYHIVRYAVLSRNPGFLDSYAPILAKALIYASLLDLMKEMRSIFTHMTYYQRANASADSSGKELLVAIDNSVRDLEERFYKFYNGVISLYRTNQGEMIKAVNEALATMQFLQEVEKRFNLNPLIFSIGR